MTVDRRKKVVVQQYGDHIHEEHVIENVNLEYRESVYKVSQVIWLLFGGLEALLGIRVILMLIGANPVNWFTAFVYQLTQLFLWPFQNLIANPSFQNMTLEVTSIIAILVYALLAWVITRLIWVIFYQRPSRQVTIYDREHN